MATEKTSVAGAQGWVLESPHGRSRIAWVGSMVKAAELSGTKFSPPIPILLNAPNETPLEWEGEIETGLASYEATGTLLVTKTAIMLLGKKTSGLQARLTVKYGDTSLETTSVYVPRLGMVSHERRENSKFLASLEYLSGP